MRLSSVSVRSALGMTLGLVALTLVALLAFCLDLGHPALWDPGEGRYAQAVREMMTSGNWLVPTLNGVPYFDKPPVFYWLVAASFTVFGTHEWAARLPAAVAALLTIAATVGFGWRRIGRGAALGAGLILATTGQFVVLGRSVRMDMLLTMLLSVALFRAYGLWQDDGGPSIHTWPLYVLPAVGLVLKGPVAIILPVGIIGALTVVTGEYDRLARLRPGPGLIAAILAAATWYVPAAIWSPDYLSAFIWQQNVGRFINASTGHSEPFWFFLWVLPVTFLPWALFLPGALRHTFRRAHRWHDLDLFLGCWIVVTVAFFSASSAKLATYVLPVFPPLALLVARYLARALAAGPSTRASAFRVPARLWTLGLALVALATPVVVAIAFADHMRPAAASLLLLPIAVGGGLAQRRACWRAMPIAIAVGALASQVLFYRVAAPVVDQFLSLRRPAELARDLPDETAIYIYKTRGHSFAFYDGRSITRLTSPKRTAAILDDPSPAAVLTKTRYLERIRQHLASPACIWWQGASGRVLLANVPPPAQADARTLAPDVWERTADEMSRFCPRSAPPRDGRRPAK